MDLHQETAAAADCRVLVPARSEIGGGRLMPGPALPFCGVMSGVLGMGGGVGGISAIAAALGGMRQAQDKLDGAAQDLAQGQASAAQPDVAGDMVTLSMANVQMAASVHVARVAEQMQKTLLDLLA